MRRRRGTRAPCHRIGPNVTPTAPYALYASRGGGPGGLTIIAILDLLGGAAQCMVAAGPNAWDSVPATDACKWMALYGGLCGMAFREFCCCMLYRPRRPRTMHVEFLVKTPTEIYCMRDLRERSHPEDSIIVRVPGPCRRLGRRVVGTVVIPASATQ